MKRRWLRWPSCTMYICWHYTNWCTHQTAHCKTTWFKLGSTAVFIFICIPPTRYEVMHKRWKDTTVITKINDFLQVRVQSVVPIGPCPQFQVKQMGLYFSDSKHRFKKLYKSLLCVIKMSLEGNDWESPFSRYINSWLSARHTLKMWTEPNAALHKHVVSHLGLLNIFLWRQSSPDRVNMFECKFLLINDDSFLSWWQSKIPEIITNT